VVPVTTSARVHADPHFKRDPVVSPQVLVECSEGDPHLGRGANGTQGVVFADGR
jgi:hypothetical protein